MVEYAYAAQLGKPNIYITFAMNITRVCDCHGREMTPITPDVGVFASTDPVAADSAVLDMIKERNRRTFRGHHALKYGERIGLGSRKYRLVTL